MFNRKRSTILLTAIFALILLIVILSPVFSSPNNEESRNDQQEKTSQITTTPEITTSEYAAMFQTVFQFVLSNYVDEVSPEQLFEGAMTGLFEGLGDPHSIYLSKSQLLDLTDTTEGEFGGLGIHIQKQVVGLNSETKSQELPYVKIISPILGTPAFKKGLKSGDYITHIEDESTIELTSDDVLDRLRGAPGTDVTISILRDRTINFDLTITRAIIEIPTINSAIIDNVGYLQISQFSNHTAAQVEEVLNDFNKEKVQGIILDVRNNPGGLLHSVVEISDFIFSDGIIVSTRSRIEEENEEFTASAGTIIPPDLPLVILTNGGSASASEILTGAIKDRERGTVIGTKTFGKGSVQQMRYFGDGGFKMTVARFYSPNGITIDKLGIEPEIEVNETDLDDLSEAEVVEYIKLLNEKIIGNFILNEKDITEEMIAGLADSIIEQGYILPKDFLVYEIRLRANRYLENPPIYDINNDQPLIKALEVLK